MTRIRNVPSVSVPRYQVALKLQHAACAPWWRTRCRNTILLDGQRAVQRAGSGAAAEDRSPHSGPAQIVEIVDNGFRHAHTLTNSMGRMVDRTVDHQIAFVAEPGLQPRQRLGRRTFDLLPVAFELAAVARAGDDAQLRLPRGQAAEMSADRTQGEKTFLGVDQINSGVHVQGDGIQRDSFRAFPR